ncbi:MAG TPA: aminotransferase class I/II-fold pyridoxal phosphate-dependent enzyme [Brevundimonas sp.]|uniref:aminotransferase class I/II-fold pyridoxal phosphate-dependent enzyme n=1 Tax=Brevundimonas sp. TaxID=1871086 RepID=UPI002625762A|nr:aminotransferase class I/II-fold pyridoxal phosphate-dependent enzyme [Brevundimonas sp.]HRO33847.1 aminotransferase class I/II-fold pyridoxal phosphate-dependent enzyme [Brevundimonas sp.]
MRPLPAPFRSLVREPEGLDLYPSDEALRLRMAQVYGVEPDCVLPVRGATHGVELALRLAAREGGSADLPDDPAYLALKPLYRLDGGGGRIAVRRAPLADAALVRAMAAADLVVLDEADIEFTDVPSRAGRDAPVVVVRSLSSAWGLAGARVGALIGPPDAVARMAQVREPHALPTPSIRLALQALDASRLAETRRRVEAVKAQRTRLVQALADLDAMAEDGPRLSIRPPIMEEATHALMRFEVPFRRRDDRLSLAVLAEPAVNDRILAALGQTATATGQPHRLGEAIRDTKETRIVCTVDLGTVAPVAIDTGIGFFDHMLEQVAAHGGFSLRLDCRGDLHIDPHHTVEDCALALGQALRQALGDRRGIARYGFVLPMDEAEAAASIDLSGRPCAVFRGDFATPMIGGYRTDLTAHVVRSLAETLGAAIHVSVSGHDDHHKTEAVFKALGRTLRQAIRVEGDAVPSTKGLL